MEASITLKKVGKLAGDKTILAGLTFGVEKGYMVAIVGGSDAGKSTLLKVMAGVENQDYGSIYIHGLDRVKRRREISPFVGYVPNDIDLDPWLTIEQNIRFTGYLYGLNDEIISSRLLQYARDLNLVGYLHNAVREVTSGILKKAMLLRALIHEPSVLLMDEPTAFMDADSYRETWDLLYRLKGIKTIVYVSQNLQEVERGHDRILVMSEGKIVLDGSLDRLLESTFDFHQFQIEFEELSDELYKKLISISKVKNPTRIGNSIHFYGRERKVFFEVMKKAADGVMVDLTMKKLGLQDLLDAEFAREGIN